MQQLLSFYGGARLMWGSDYPFVLLGGHARNGYALEYAQAPGMLKALEVPGLDEKAKEQLMGGTAQRLFGF